MLKFYSTMAVSVIALQAIAGPAYAGAQINANDGAKDSAKNSGLEEIVITAQMRREDLQKVPISVYAMTGDALEKAHISDVYDLASYVPSFQTDNVGPADPTFTIRGIGSNDRGAGSDRSVVVFLDGVYIGRSSGTVFDLYDLDRIEVLRGPQGTLSGRNVVGGAINVVTKTPTKEFKAKAEATIGNYNAREAKGSVSGALYNNVAASLSFVTKERNGFNTYLPTGRDIDSINSTGIRSKVAITPNDDLKIVLSGDVSRFRQDGISHVPYPIGTYLTNTLHYTAVNGPRDVVDEMPGFANIDVWGLSSRIDLNTNIGTVTSITGFRHASADSAQNSIGLPAGHFLSDYFADEVSSTISQELRLASLPDSGRLTWVVGAYYSHDNVKRVEGYVRNLLGATSNPIYNEHSTTESIAAFGQATYKVTDQINLTAGARYSHDQKHMDNFLIDGSHGTATNGLAPATSLFNVSVGQPFHSFTPKFTIDYSPTKEALLYATVSKGFKSGGFQGLAVNAGAASRPFRPETVWNYEAGVKSRWLDDHLQVNVAGFYMNYKDLQISNRILLVPGDEASAIKVITNASDARIKGIEADVIAKPLAGLTLAASYSYLNTKVVNFILGTDGTDLSGHRLPKASKNAYTLSGTYVLPLDENSDLTFFTSYAYKGNFYFFIENAAAGYEKGYGLLNGRITYHKANWSLSAWGNNITNKLYRTSAVVVGGTTSFSGFGDPATYGVTLGFNF